MEPISLVKTIIISTFKISYLSLGVRSGAAVLLRVSGIVVWLTIGRAPAALWAFGPLPVLLFQNKGDKS